jgi:phospholipid transport system transporter-binding protein
MSATDATVSITEQSSGRFLVSGHLTFASARAARAGGQAAFAATQATHLVVDCSGVVRGDSAGLAVVLEWLGWAKRAQRRLTLENLPLAIIAIARISEVDELLLARAD